MRIKIKDSILTIPNELIKNINTLDIETANAINTLINKGERVISTNKQKSAKNALKIKITLEMLRGVHHINCVNRVKII